MRYQIKDKLHFIPVILWTVLLWRMAGFFLPWLYEYSVPAFTWQEGDQLCEENVYIIKLQSRFPVYSYVWKLYEKEWEEESEEYISQSELEVEESKETAKEDTVENGFKVEDGTIRQKIREEQEKAPKNMDTPIAGEFNPIDYAEYDTFLKHFYTIDQGTYLQDHELSIPMLIDVNCKMEIKKDTPQILIYHTHSKEAYISETGEPSSVVEVGEILTKILQEKYGYSVLHYTESFDEESRDYAYSRALPAIEQVLKTYPTIEVVIDLHRDEMKNDVRLVQDVYGIPTANIMFFNGLSRLKSKGDIIYLSNPNKYNNLGFSFQMQVAFEEYYPGLTRKIYLKGYRYNMHLIPKTLLVELGAQNNTYQEAVNACGPLARILHLVLSGQT